MTQRTTLLTAATIGMLAVILGASGAHNLKPLLVQLGKFEVFELATRYQFYHALALLGVGILQSSYPSQTLRYASVCFLVGVLLFSGSLYFLCFIKLGGLGIVTPIGGLFLIGGWALLFLGVYKK